VGGEEPSVHFPSTYVSGGLDAGSGGEKTAVMKIGLSKGKRTEPGRKEQNTHPAVKAKVRQLGEEGDQMKVPK